MFPEECKNFINQYVSNDHTNRALYLHAPHGHGKTHFIKEELSKQENISYKCIMVSLSGITTLAELSKAIFLAAHQFKNTAKAKRAETVSHIIAKNVAAQFNIDLSLSETDLQTFYDVVNFHNRLLVIDDVESATQIHGFWGYIKGLLFDDVKVLLVSSEEPPYQEEHVVSIIGDKLLFQYKTDILHLLVKNITEAHQCNSLKSYLEHNHSLVRLVKQCQCDDLHVFRFACEKTCKFLNAFPPKSDIYVQQIWKSMLLLSPLYLAGNTSTLPEPYHYIQDYQTKHLESRNAIYNSCLQYLKQQETSETALRQDNRLYIRCIHLNRDDDNENPVLQRFHFWRELDEPEMRKAFTKLQSVIEKNQISWLSYTYVLHDMYVIKEERPSINLDLHSVIQDIKHNLHGQHLFLRQHNVPPSHVIRTTSHVPQSIVDEIIETINQPYNIEDNFQYTAENFENYFLEMTPSYDVQLYDQRYLSAYNLQRFSAMFQQPTPKLCEQMKELMKWLYSGHQTIAPEELSFLQEFNASITNILEKPYHKPFEIDILHSLQTDVNRWIQRFAQPKTPTSN